MGDQKRGNTVCKKKGLNASPEGWLLSGTGSKDRESSHNEHVNEIQQLCQEKSPSSGQSGSISFPCRPCQSCPPPSPTAEGTKTTSFRLQIRMHGQGHTEVQHKFIPYRADTGQEICALREGFSMCSPEAPKTWLSGPKS